MKKLIILLIVAITPFLLKSQIISDKADIPIAVSLKVNSENSGIFEIRITNNSDTVMAIKGCFDFQTIGELKGSDISILVKRDDGKFYAPIAVHYTKDYTDCFLFIKANSDTTLLFSMDHYFRKGEGFNNGKEYTVKVQIITKLVYRRNVYPYCKFVSNEILYTKP
jgi:hypothetical protein